MTTSFGSAFRSFWHTMTSYDRRPYALNDYASELPTYTIPDSSFDSPYRSGRHVPLNGGGIGGLTSVATASESRADITSPFHDDTGRLSTSALDAPTTAYQGAGASQSLPSSPAGGRPYSPGMRSFIARRANTVDGFEMASPTGEIPMQSFQDGLPPPPPVSHTWKRIDKWAEENYPELFDQICDGCTNNDINELEHQLDCSLPQDVRESLQCHDGQERGGIPTGIIFSAMLLDCEEIVQEWDNWRKVNQEYLLDTAVVNKPSIPTKALGGSSEASSSKPGQNSPTAPNNGMWRQDLMARQDSIPANAVQKAYAHPAWIPLVRDWGGNNLAVDLAPGPTGHWGQVILFGRDYDTKYVVARSWSAFLALVADDLNSGKWFVDEETNELKLREFKKSRVEPAYFDILRWRMDQKYGRRNVKRKSVAPGGMASPTGSASPYASPTDVNGEARGRSMQRLSPNSPMASPIRLAHPKPSPLARVTEEALISAPSLEIEIPPNGPLPSRKLVEVETPRPSGDGIQPARLEALTTNGELGTASPSSAEALTTATEGSVKMNGKQPLAADDAMKTIEI